MTAEGGELVRSVEAFQAPFGQKVELQEVAFEGGVRLLRLRIREGSRFTVLDLDRVTAARWGQAMAGWAADAPMQGGGE